MSLLARQVTRSVLDLVLTLAGWGLVIGAGVALLNGSFILAIVLFIAGIVSFKVSAASHRSHASGRFMLDEFKRVEELLLRGQYAQGEKASREIVTMAETSPNFAPAIPLALVWHALALAAGRKFADAQDALAHVAARVQASGVPEDYEVLDPMVELIVNEIHRGVPDPGRMVREFRAVGESQS